MSTALVSAFYDINDVIQQSKVRPSSLDLRTINNFNRRPSNGPSLITRRHSTTGGSSPKPLTPHIQNGLFPLTSSPKDSPKFFPQIRERSMSISSAEDVENQFRKQRGERGSTNSARYKTELCRPYEENGTCKYGDKCQFAHGAHELRSLNRHPKYKTEYCRTFHTIGFCPYGPRCHFIHSRSEKRQVPTTPSQRTGSMTSLNSGPPSPTVTMEAVPSPFASLTPPTSPSLSGEVFLFGDEAVKAVSQVSPSTSPVSMSASSGSSGNSSPIPLDSRIQPAFPSPPLSTDLPACTSTPLSPVIPTISSAGPKSPQIVLQQVPSSERDLSPPLSPCDSNDIDRRRLPVFNRIA